MSGVLRFLSMASSAPALEEDAQPRGVGLHLAERHVDVDRYRPILEVREVAPLQTLLEFVVASKGDLACQRRLQSLAATIPSFLKHRITGFRRQREWGNFFATAYR
ncbi:hypothetical protein LCM4576_21850 [Mesorhizobium sp. LCM 4576]|nr:hypothetical protein LCM4576_21850 [Mesorhizobium sp. LCM 4576]